MSEYDEYSILCNFGGRIMSGFKVLNERLQSPPPPPLSWPHEVKKEHGLNRLRGQNFTIVT